MKESQLVAKIMEAVRQKYPRIYCRKLSDRFNRGLPDLLILYGRYVQNRLTAGVLFVETKTARGRVAPIQEEEARQINNVACFGCSAIFARDVRTVLDTLEAAGAE